MLHKAVLCWFATTYYGFFGFLTSFVMYKDFLT
jgi:hypothetical protein